MQGLEGFELQGHGVGTGLGCVAVFQTVIVVVLDRILILVPRKRPEAIEVNPVAEPSRQCVHKQTSGRALDVYLVSQPVPRRAKKK